MSRLKIAASLVLIGTALVLSCRSSDITQPKRVSLAAAQQLAPDPARTKRIPYRAPKVEDVNTCIVSRPVMENGRRSVTYDTIQLDMDITASGGSGDEQQAPQRFSLVERSGSTKKTTRAVNCVFRPSEVSKQSLENAFVSLEARARTVRVSRSTMRGELLQRGAVDTSTSGAGELAESAADNDSDVAVGSEDNDSVEDDPNVDLTLASNVYPSVGISRARLRGDVEECWYYDEYPETIYCGEGTCEWDGFGYYCGWGCYMLPIEGVLVWWCECMPGYEWDFEIEDCVETGQGGGGGGDPPPPSQPALNLSCSNTDITRGDSIACTAMPTSGNLVVTQWDFAADEAGFDNVMSLADANPLPTVWAGRMIATGNVTVTGQINGANPLTSAPVRIVVAARTTFGTNIPQNRFTTAEIANNLPQNPREWAHLGFTTHHVVLETGVTNRTITTGPNRNMAYMLTMPWLQSSIRINRPAFALTHPWIGAHDDPRTVPFCSKTTVRSIEGLVEEHEGLEHDADSHARTFRTSLGAHSDLGGRIEAARSTSGPLVAANVLQAIATEFAAAENASEALDPVNYQIRIGTCTVFWGY